MPPRALAWRTRSSLSTICGARGGKKITYPSSGNNSAFTYDPLGNRVKIIESTSGSVTSTKQFIAGEERDGSGNIVKRFYSRGLIIGVTAYFYDIEHNGSIRSITDDNGVVQAAYSFDSFGRETKLEGAFDSDYGFAGMYRHQRSGLNFTSRRAFSSDLGRFINRDPIEEEGGINLYQYAGNDPVNMRDPLGFSSKKGKKVPKCEKKKKPRLSASASRNSFRGSGSSGSGSGSSQGRPPDNCPGSGCVPLPPLPPPPQDPDEPIVMGGIPRPPRVTLRENIAEAEKHPADYLWFANQVKKGGPWDYKTQGLQYSDFANLNYGATAAAASIPLEVALRAAGWAQSKDDPASGVGNWWSGPPYGDQLDDQQFIRKGYDAYGTTLTSY